MGRSTMQLTGIKVTLPGIHQGALIGSKKKKKFMPDLEILIKAKKNDKKGRE